MFTIPLYKKGTIEEPKGCQLKIRGALDDHYNSNSQYELLIKLNGQLKWRGNASKEFLHGRPYGKPFENWRTLSFDVPAYELRESKPIIKFEHRGSSENDWIAIDYMEVVCENGSQRTELSGYKGYGEEDKETGIIYGGKTEAWPLEVNQLLGK